jgi:hypothetical protein
MKKLLSVIALAAVLSGCGLEGAVNDAGAKRDTFSIDTEAGRAVCVSYVVHSASIDCTWLDR